MITIACSHCSTKYKVDPDRFSSPKPKIRCKNCNEVFEADLSGGAVVAPARAPAPAPAPVPVQAAAVPAATTGGKRILVAHESPQIVAQMKDSLRAAGYDAHSVTDGISALVEIEKGGYTVAVLDVSLPKMFGFEVCEVIRRDSALDETKLLLIAAIYHKDRYRRPPPNLYGADAYVEKHVLLEELVPSVEALISGHPADDFRQAQDDSPALAPPMPAHPANSGVPGSHSEAFDDAPALVPPGPIPQPAPVASAPKAPAPVSSAVPPGSIPAGIDEKALEKARRMGRVMVSDLALYNKDVFARARSPKEIYDKLHTDVEECRAQIQNKVSEAIRQYEDVLEIAIVAYLAKHGSGG